MHKTLFLEYTSQFLEMSTLKTERISPKTSVFPQKTASLLMNHPGSTFYSGVTYTGLQEHEGPSSTIGTSGGSAYSVDAAKSRS